jgi:hypothetical protein
MSGFLLMHFGWDFLSVYDRFLLGTFVSPVFKVYAALRHAAAHRSIGYLRHPRPAPAKRPLNLTRAYDMAIALLRHDFRYDDFIRSFGGLYTYHGRDWDAIWDIIDSVNHQATAQGYPTIDPDRTLRIFTLGVPLVGRYCCPFEVVSARNMYDNHPTLHLDGALDLVRDKFRKEEELSYNVVFPRWLWRFISGLFLSPLTFVMPKHALDDGRICVDASNGVPGDRSCLGAPNHGIPKPGAVGAEDESPQVEYGTAFRRFLEYIWNLRIDRPATDIYLQTDDISAAFHRIFYHPSMMPAFASVFEGYLAIPAGSIFGGATSPGYYMAPAELRAWLASVFNFVGATTELTKCITLAPPMRRVDRHAMAVARACPLHPGVERMRAQHPGGGFLHLHSSFVDDTGNAGYHDTMHQVVTQSVLSAYVIFGFPGSDRWGNRPDVINATKWQVWVCNGLRYLGYDLDAAKMTVRWPYAKRFRLADTLTQLFADAAPRRSGNSAQLFLIARVLGLARNGGLVSKIGLFSILRLQYCANDAVRAHFSGLPASFDLCRDKHLLQRWWRRVRISLPPEVWLDLRWLMELLDLGRPMSPHWCQPIGLLIRRTPDFLMYSDASYEGIGGWCRFFGLLWRVTTAELVQFGFPVDSDEYLPHHTSTTKLHINPLEFIGIIIELWFCLAFIRQADPAGQRQWVVLIRADNTSALSWMLKAARCRDLVVRRLARFLQALLTFSPVPLSLQALHLPGTENESADILSRPITRAPSVASAIALAGPTLQNLQHYQVPHELLSSLLEVVTGSSIEVFTEKRTTKLLTLVPAFSLVG